MAGGLAVELTAGGPATIEPWPGKAPPGWRGPDRQGHIEAERLGQSVEGFYVNNLERDH